MRHLSRQEFIDFVDGGLAPERVAHVDECARCRKQVEALRVVVRDAHGVTVPEPSPLFWEHLSTRVRNVVAADSRVGGNGNVTMRWWRTWNVGRLAGVVTAVTVVIALGVGVWILRGPGPLGGNAAVANDSTGGGADMMVFENDEPDWTLLLAIADAVEWADADTDEWLVDRYTVEEVVLEMSADERLEFARLLEAEFDGAPGDPASSL